MKNTFLFFFLLISLSSFSQTVHARIMIGFPIEFSNDSLKKDTATNILKTINPKAIIAYDVIELVDGDTTVIYLNETPELREDEETNDRLWSEANDAFGRDCLVILFHYKETGSYQLRVVYLDTNTGYEYYMNPLRVDIIPYKKADKTSLFEYSHDWMCYK